MSLTFRDRAVVLRSVPMKDADRRYVVFGEERGKMALLAKGTRRGKSKMSPHMAWFGCVDIMVAKGKAMDRLAGASLFRGYPGIMESLPKAAAAQGFLSAVDFLTRPEQPDGRVFRLIGEFLETLEESSPARSPDGRGPVMDAALLKLLDSAGFGPELDRCVRCRGALGHSLAISFLRGGLECPACRQADSLPVLLETADRLRRFRGIPLRQAALEPPPFQAAARIVETLVASQSDGRHPALDFMRRVS